MISSQMLSSRPAFCANRYSGSRPATIGSIFVLRKKNSTSVHFRTGLMLRAYAAGKHNRSTRTVDRMLAVRLLSNGGHGDAPPEKNSRYPSRVSGANTEGGLVAASASEWNEVRTIHSTGSTNRIPTTHASSESQGPPRSFFLGTEGATTAVIGRPPA